MDGYCRVCLAARHAGCRSETDQETQQGAGAVHSGRRGEAAGPGLLKGVPDAGGFCAPDQTFPDAEDQQISENGPSGVADDPGEREVEQWIGQQIQQKHRSQPSEKQCFSEHTGGNGQLNDLGQEQCGEPGRQDCVHQRVSGD